jgi:hypothetical protein
MHPLLRLQGWRPSDGATTVIKILYVLGVVSSTVMPMALALGHVKGYLVILLFFGFTFSDP